MAVATYTKSGTKATTAAKLDKAVFGIDVKNHDLLKQAYTMYLANGRIGSANVKNRGDVRGGGRKPWKQKGTGRARFGSTRNPIWRGGGIVFGPTGEQNHTKKLPVATKRLAIRQALSMAAGEDRIKVIETFECKTGKTSETVKLMQKIGLDRNVLLVVDVKDTLVERSTRNIPFVKAVQANYLNVYDVTNANAIVVTKKALEMIHTWLGTEQAPKKEEAAK
jgi:large subunit ribosomal protein L4